MQGEIMTGIMMQTAILVIAILVVRKLFGEKLHAYIRYGLWLLVALRLLIPVNVISSPASMLHVTDMAVARYREAGYASVLSGGRTGEDELSRAVPDSPVADDTESTAAENHPTKVESSIETENQLTKAEDSVQTDNQSAGKAGDSVQTDNQLTETGSSVWTKNQPTDGTGSVWTADQKTGIEDSAADNDRLAAANQRISADGLKVFRIIWMTGSIFVGGFLLTAHYRFRSRLCRIRRPLRKDRADSVETLPIYHVNGLESPCLAGILHPAVYIGSEITPDSEYFRYIVTHENVHYLHGDHIWALLRAVLITIYWFHPLVWIAAAASARDGEIACDYGTVRRLGEEKRMSYGTMLLDLSGGNGKRRIYSYGTMLRPGRSEMKERILRLTAGNGGRMTAGVLAVLFMFIVAGCAFTGTSQEGSADGTGGAAAADAAAPEYDSNTIGNSGAGSDHSAGNGIENIDDIDDRGDSSRNENLSGEGNVPGSENLSGVGKEDTDGGNHSAAGDLFDPDEKISGQRQLTAVSAALSEETPFGADGPSLDYAGHLRTGKENIIIFHDYFGLVVYDLTNGKVLRSLDLARIDCHMTQGDNVCRIKVSADGTTVWLHPGTRQYMFRYEVEQNLLYQVPIVKTFDIDLEAEDLFDCYLVTEGNNESWYSNYLYEEYKDERGFQTAYIYLWISGDDEQKFGSLQCVWDDMVYLLCDEDGAWLEQEEADGDFPYVSDGAAADIEIFYDEPCAYSRISDAFGSRLNPVTGDVVAHEGIDYAAEEGTVIAAAADGVVYEKGSSDEYGIYVVLLHANSDMTYYCHCREVTVADGERVKRGEKIAEVGNTGRSTGAHLHFALSRNGRFLDPAEYMERKV